MNVPLVGSDVTLCMAIFQYIVWNSSMFLCDALYSIENMEF